MDKKISDKLNNLVLKLQKIAIHGLCPAIGKPDTKEVISYGYGLD